MAEHTTHYNITKPTGSEAGDVSVINANMDIIDGQLYENEQGIQENAEAIANIYPVGSIYMSTNATSPATIFGGTWEQMKDKFLLGAGDTYTAGATGGSADAVVVAHSHSVGVAGQAGTGTTSYGTVRLNAEWSSQTSGVTGEDGTGKNMPPYLAVYMWKRVA